MAEFSEEDIRQLVSAAKELERSLKIQPRYFEDINLSGDAGTNTWIEERVEPHWLLHVTHMSAYDATSSPTRIRLGFNNGRHDVYPKIQPAPLTYETVEFNGELLLREGMYPKIVWDGVTSGDDLYAIVLGWWEKV